MPNQTHRTSRLQVLDGLLASVSVLSADLAVQDPLTGHLDQDTAELQKLMKPSGDLEVRMFPQAPVPAALVYQAGMADLKTIAPAIIPSIERGKFDALPALEKTQTLGGALEAVFQGKILLLLDGYTEALVLASSTLPSSNEPRVDRVVLGPHTGFTARLKDNVALMREAVTSRRLRAAYYSVGTVSPAQVALLYIEGLAPPSVKREFEQRLQRAEIGGVQDIGQLQPALADSSWSPFPNVQPTERIDMCSMSLLKGRYVLLGPNSPTALLFPTGLVDLMKSPEDEYLPRFVATFTRLLRYFATFGAMTLEPLFISVTSLHQELLPASLALAIARSRVGVALPVFAEIISMALIIEVLREASIRLPKVLGQTITIVGGLVIGNSVIRANLISAPGIVVIAITAIASFIIPNYQAAIAIRLLRFPGMFIASVLGLYGISWYFLILVIHVAKLRSFGVAYLAPIAPARRLFSWRVLRISEAFVGRPK